MKATKELFRSKYDCVDAFYLRADLLRHSFGMWDCCDPISHILLDLAETQNEISDLFEAEGSYGIECEAAFREAVARRHDVGKRLLAALEDRKHWPDPDLGRR